MPYLKKVKTKFEEVESLFNDIERQRKEGKLVGTPEQQKAAAIAYLNNNSKALERNLNRFKTVNPEMLQIKAYISMLYNRSEPVLFTGPTGVGKEILARALKKDDHPFCAENCAAIPENLMESIFFGHVKGAFTGAYCDHIGLLEAAGGMNSDGSGGGGVVFLDEIGDAPLHLQAKLLRAIQEQEIRRVGDTELIEINCRFVAATKYDLEERISQKLFRDDLYARLMTFTLFIPPLKDRPEDIPVITESYMPSKEAFEKLPPFPNSVMENIYKYNVRGIESALACWRAVGRFELSPRKYGQT